MKSTPPTLWCATLTPFSEGRPDLAKVAAHVQYLRACGVDAFGPTGTTGEFLYLRPHEKAEIHRATIEAADGALVMPCVFDPDPGIACDLARRAEDRGAYGVFLPPPIYQPVHADDICAWYARIVDAVRIPVYAYHHPRTHNPIDYPLLERLFDLGVQGMKDSSGDVRRVRFLAQCFPKRIIAGSDQLLGQHRLLGPVAGQMSRLANLRPVLCRALVDGGTRAADEAAERDRVISAIDAAGKLPAMKAALGMGCRAPVTWRDEDLAGRLRPDPVPEGPPLDA